MRKFLQQQFHHFDKSDIWPGRRFQKAMLPFFLWAIPAFLFVLWSNAYYPNVSFYQDAIREGIGPNLWNVIGSFGLFLFGVAVVFLKYSLPSIMARVVLSNTYAIGSLAFGLLLGQWSVYLVYKDFIWWEIGLFGIKSGYLLGIVFIDNLILWYLAFLIQNDGNVKSSFLKKLEQMHWLWRITFGMAICCIISWKFLTMK